MRNAAARVVPCLLLLFVAPPRGIAAGADAPPSSAADAAPSAPSPREPAARSEGFGEKMLVREVGAVVELPDLFRLRRRTLGPQDFQVLEDGVSRPVVKASALATGEAAPWEVVVYVDRALARPETVFYSTNSLAQHAAQLTALGAVDVVVADPQRHIVVSGCREARVLEQTLTEVAGAAQAQRDHPTTAAGNPSLTTIRHQEDRLVAFLAARPAGGPRALILVSDGFDTSDSGGKAASAVAAVAEEPARTLAAYGWITIAAPIRRQKLGVEHREMTDIERSRQSSSGRDAPGSVTQPAEILPQAAPNTRLNWDGMLNLFIQPSSATLTGIASATAGTVVGFPDQLTRALDSLAKRWQLYYLAPDPEDGRPRSVEVRLLPSGPTVRVPVWRRSSTPETIAAARLRDALDGSPEHGALAVRATPAADHRSLELAVGPYELADAVAAGPYRLSITYSTAGADMPVVRHEILSRANMNERGWSEVVQLDPPPGAHQVAVEVEDLAHQVWGTTITSL